MTKRLPGRGIAALLSSGRQASAQAAAVHAAEIDLEVDKGPAAVERARHASRTSGMSYEDAIERERWREVWGVA